MNKRIPIIYSYLYSKIKKSTNTSVIFQDKLKELIGRTMVRKGGLPRFIIKYIIEDLIYFEIIKRVDCRTYNILDSNCDKRLRILLD